MSNNSSNTQQGSGQSLATLLAALQQGVIAINNLTQTMKSIFPSS
jgi:hypothetical protein